jgi:predicted aldo/keto reductase-like oxidoreductase
MKIAIKELRSIINEVITEKRSINLSDTYYTYHSSDSVDELVKAARDEYTYNARKMNLTSSSDPKFLDFLVQKLQRRLVPDDIIKSVLFALRTKSLKKA